jgi:hypothetical protein
MIQTVAACGGIKVSGQRRDEANLQTTRKKVASRLRSSFVSKSVSVRLQNNPSTERNKSCTTRHPGLRVKKQNPRISFKKRGFYQTIRLKNGGA